MQYPAASVVCCDKCDCWVYFYCNNICKRTYRKLKKDCTPWYCKSCLKKEISFFDLHGTEFSAFTNGMSILPKKNIYESKVFEKFNTFTENEASKCKYYMRGQLNRSDLEKHDKKCQ